MVLGAPTELEAANIEGEAVRFPTRCHVPCGICDVDVPWSPSLGDPLPDTWGRFAACTRRTRNRTPAIATSTIPRIHIASPISKSEWSASPAQSPTGVRSQVIPHLVEDWPRQLSETLLAPAVQMWQWSCLRRPTRKRDCLDHLRQ